MIRSSINTLATPDGTAILVLSNFHRFILKTETFVVYLDKTSKLQWRASTPLSSLPEECQNVISGARMLAAIPTSYLDSTNYEAWNRIIAEAVALALSGLGERSKSALNFTQTFVVNRARETARLWIVQASTITLFGFFTQDRKHLLVPIRPVPLRRDLRLRVIGSRHGTRQSR